MSLHESLQKEGPAATTVTNPDVDGMYLLEQDQDWFRVKILSLVSAAVRVQLVDWGDTVDTWLQNLRHISAKSKAVPVYCFKFKLADTTPEMYFLRYQRLFAKFLKFCQEENVWILAVKRNPLAALNRVMWTPSMPRRHIHQVRRLRSLMSQEEEKFEKSMLSKVMRAREDKESNKSQRTPWSSEQSNDETVAQLKKEIQGLQAYIAELEATTMTKRTPETRPQPTLTNEQVDHIVHTLSDELAKVELENKELKGTIDELKKQVSESCSKSELGSVNSDGTEDIVHVLSDELTRVESENKSLKETVEGLKKQMSLENAPESLKNELSSAVKSFSDKVAVRIKLAEKRMKESVEKMFEELPDDRLPFNRSENVKIDDDMDQFMRDEWSRLNDWFDTLDGKSKDETVEQCLQNLSSRNSEDIGADSSDNARIDPQLNGTGEGSIARVESESKVSEEESKAGSVKIDCAFDHLHDELSRAFRSQHSMLQAHSEFWGNLDHAFDFIPDEVNRALTSPRFTSQVQNVSVRNLQDISAENEPKNLSNKVEFCTQPSSSSEKPNSMCSLGRKAAEILSSSKILQDLNNKINTQKIPEVFKDSAQDYLQNLPQVSWRTRSLISGFSHADTSLNVILGQPVVEDTTFKMQMETLPSFRSFSIEFTNNHSRVVLQLKASVFPEYAFILNSLDENWGPGEKHQFLLEPSSFYDFCFVIKRDHIELQVSEILSKRNVTIKYRHRMPPSEIRYIHISGDVIVCGASVVEAENACCQEMRERLHTAFVEYTDLSYRMAAVKSILKEKSKKSKKPKMFGATFQQILNQKHRTEKSSLSSSPPSFCESDD